MAIYDAIARTIAKSIALVAPGYAREYLKNHAVVRAYEAAKTTGANRNFRPTQSSGAQELTESWQQVTNKARALGRDNSHVAGMARRFVAGLVGEGSWPRPKVLKSRKSDAFDFNKELNNEILRRWERFAPEACANGDSIYQLQRIAAYAFFFDGGLLIRKHVKNRRLMLEPIELDLLDTLKDTDDGKVRIVGGKELDQFNKPIAYWLKSRFPTEKDSASVRVPANEIIDLYDRERASSVGGISRIASAIINFHNIGKYRADTMSLARTALGFGVFVETEFPDDFFGQNSTDTDEGGNEYQFVTPGGVHYLRPGEKINTVKPENPGTQYGPFLTAELRSASVGAGMSYESVSNDGSQTNFSGTRQMLLFERAMMRYTFAIFEEKFYSKIYQWFIEFERDFGKPALVMPGYDSDPLFYLRCTWSRPKTEWVDPLKDAKAAKEEIEMGANTITDFCETAGRDFEEIVATRKYETELLKAAGLVTEQVIAETTPSEETPDQKEQENGGLAKWQTPQI